MIKCLKWIIVVTTILTITIIWISNRTIERATNSYVYNDLESIPCNKVGLLLGTSKFLKSGLPNHYFSNRIKATDDLYKSNKIEIVVISGDNSKKDYNEPLDMKNELVKKGISESKIYLDYAGFRTFDSVVRMEKIFGQRSFTVISQDFHNRRAIYLAKRLGLNTIGYNAEDVELYNGFKTKLREKFARVKVFVDLLIKKKPKFLGERIEIK